MEIILIIIGIIGAVGLGFFIHERRLLRKLSDPDQGIRLDAVKKLGKTLAAKAYHETTIVKRLLKVAEADEQALVRAEAIRVVADYLFPGSITTRPLFRSDLKHDAVQVWLNTLEDEHTDVREAAVRAIGESKTQSLAALKPLLNALDDANGRVRTGATAALANVCPAVKTIIFGERDDEEIPERMYAVYNPDVSKLTVPIPRLKHIVIDVETCERAQVMAFARYMLVYLDEDRLQRSVTVRIEGNPIGFGREVYEACTRCRHVDVSIETVIFGSLCDLPHDPYTTLYNPNVSALTIPMPRLRTIIIHADTCDFLQSERFLTYAMGCIGQSHIKKHVDAYIHGDPEHLHPNLRNSLTNLCKQVHIHKDESRIISGCIAP